MGRGHEVRGGARSVVDVGNGDRLLHIVLILSKTLVLSSGGGLQLRIPRNIS